MVALGVVKNGRWPPLVVVDSRLCNPNDPDLTYSTYLASTSNASDLTISQPHNSESRDGAMSIPLSNQLPRRRPRDSDEPSAALVSINKSHRDFLCNVDQRTGCGAEPQS